MSSIPIGVVIPKGLREQLFHPQDWQKLQKLGDVRSVLAEHQTSQQEAIEILRDCHIGVGSWGTPYPNAEILAACPHLKLWEHVAGTVKSMFGPHLHGKDLQIASCKTAIATDVAEMTVGLMINTLRRIPENALANRAGITPMPANLKVLRWSTIGIVGASEVGRLVIELLQHFGCKIQLFDPFVNEAQARDLGVRLFHDLSTLCASSDLVSLHTPDLPSTKHIMGAREFAAMRDDAIFINTARGACIDETALTEELEKGRLFACLDVSSPEPTPANSPLRRLPNVIYTSHIAGPPSFTLGHQAVSDIEKYLRGESPLYVVREEMLEHIA